MAQRSIYVVGDPSSWLFSDWISGKPMKMIWRRLKRFFDFWHVKCNLNFFRMKIENMFICVSPWPVDGVGQPSTIQFNDFVFDQFNYWRLLKVSTISWSRMSIYMQKVITIQCLVFVIINVKQSKRKMCCFLHAHPHR